MKPNNTAIPKQYSLIKLYNTFIFKHPTCFMITVSFSGMTFAVKQYEQNISITFDIHGSVHCRWLSRNTNKMQLCNRIYYSKVHWRPNMFRAAHRSSSGALNRICSLWFIYPCGVQSLPRLRGKWIHFPLSLGNGRTPHGYINQRLQIRFRAPDDERCAARNMLGLQWTLE